MKTINSATKSDIDLINQLIPPTKGVNAGDGLHILIHENWNELIASGIEVPGCTYAKIDSDGSMAVDSVIEQKLMDTSKLNAGDKVKVNSLSARVADKVETAVKLESIQDKKG